MSEIILNRIFGPPERILLDTDTGRVNPMENTDQRNPTGNCCVLDSGIAALYVEKGVLYFQLNANRWDMASSILDMEYWHVFDKKNTIFSVDGIQIEYPAWWRDDPCFEPNLPEYDEVEDYLGYIYAVKQDEQLRLNLTNGWSNP